jgi:hypothetical protein
MRTKVAQEFRLFVDAQLKASPHRAALEDLLGAVLRDVQAFDSELARVEGDETLSPIGRQRGHLAAARAFAERMAAHEEGPVAVIAQRRASALSRLMPTTPADRDAGNLATVGDLRRLLRESDEARRTVEAIVRLDQLERDRAFRAAPRDVQALLAASLPVLETKPGASPKWSHVISPSVRDGVALERARQERPDVAAEIDLCEHCNEVLASAIATASEIIGQTLPAGATSKAGRAALLELRTH